MTDILDLHQRVAMVTGAGQGVGRQVALRLAEHNAGAVIVNDFHLERAEAVAAEVEALGIRALAISGDVSDYEAVASSVKQAQSALGPIEILINNAGNAGPAPTSAMEEPFWRQSRAEWDGYLGTNLYGVMNTVHSVLPEMIAHSYGRIVTVISDAGRVGEPGREAYSAAKAGAAGFMRAVAKSTGRYLITANCVSLAATRTPRTEAALDDAEQLKKMMSHYVIRRPGTPEDAANMILFLASDAASWITGQTVPVNGGYSFTL